MIRISILCLLASFYGQVVSATTVSIGDVASWTQKVSDAKTYLWASKSEGLQQLPNETRESAMSVLGLVEGLRLGSLFSVVLRRQIAFDEGETLHLNDIVSGYCIDEATIDVVARLESFLARETRHPNSDFEILLLEFLRNEYPCQ